MSSVRVGVPRARYRDCRGPGGRGPRLRGGCSPARPRAGVETSSAPVRGTRRAARSVGTDPPSCRRPRPSPSRPRHAVMLPVLPAISTLYYRRPVRITGDRIDRPRDPVHSEPLTEARRVAVTLRSDRCQGNHEPAIVWQVEAVVRAALGSDVCWCANAPTLSTRHAMTDGDTHPPRQPARAPVTQKRATT
jgi:hypothetical protein